MRSAMIPSSLPDSTTSVSASAMAPFFTATNASPTSGSSATTSGSASPSKSPWPILNSAELLGESVATCLPQEGNCPIRCWDSVDVYGRLLEDLNSIPPTRQIGSLSKKPAFICASIRRRPPDASRLHPASALLPAGAHLSSRHARGLQIHPPRLPRRPRQISAVRMRHRAGNQRARTLLHPLLRHRHGLRGLRRGNHLSFSLGHIVSHLARPASCRVRAILHVRFSRHPSRRIRLALQKGRARSRMIPCSAQNFRSRIL